ncbi:phage tail protein [Gryllotalpicola koreensis]|uniref:Tail fiber protein n=1 Tax=Gryllotalpicola koreensis TaxID=993086 RepID=A0ABP7ZQE6_9MICO
MDPFVGEIRLFSIPFTPRGWAACNGQLLQISQNTALFSLLGTSYGGDGRVTFALPNLNGRVAVGQGDNWPLGQQAGEERHTLTVTEIPQHTHAAHVATSATQTTPSGALPAAGGSPQFTSGPGSDTFAPSELGLFGGGQAHENMPPFLALQYCIALTGVFPSRD